MTKPIIADTKPQVMTLSPGKYYWCSCGVSKNQPFCVRRENIKINFVLEQSWDQKKGEFSVKAVDIQQEP